MFPIDKLRNLMRQEAAGVLATFSQTRIGIVDGYDPNNYTATVLIQPEGIKTGGLPILTEWVGNLWGFYAPPTIGDQVIVHFMEGDFSTGFIGQRIFNITQQPTNNSTTPSSGEFWLVHKTGTYLKLHNDGTIELKTLDSNSNQTNINITSNMVMTGNLTVNGNVALQGSGAGNLTSTGDIRDNINTNTNTVKQMRTIYDTHTHGGVSVGGGNTANPNQPM